MKRNIIFILALFLLQACGSDQEEQPPSFRELQSLASGSGKGLENVARLRKTCRCEQCDMKNVDLSYFRPAENKLFAARTVGQHFVQSTCDISYANLEGANLSNINISAKTSNYCTIPENLGCDSFIASTQAVKTNFKNADLRNALLINVSFNQANFEGATLEGAEITRSQFGNANFENANLTNVKAFSDPVLGLQADMRGADFKKANLMGSNLTAIFTSAKFRAANLENAYLNTDQSISAGLLPWQGVDFIEANLKGAMIGINKKEGQHNPGIGKAVIKNALLCKTIMPDGSTENRDCRRAELNRERG